LEWITTAFSETAIAWTHLKAVRLFVESVLRFGLPVCCCGYRLFCDCLYISIFIGSNRNDVTVGISQGTKQIVENFGQDY